MCPVGYVVSVPAMDTQPGGNLASWDLMSEKGTGVLHFPKRPPWSPRGADSWGLGTGYGWGLRGTKSLRSLMSLGWMVSL